MVQATTSSPPIHIEEFEVRPRVTPSSVKEDITRDIPNVGEEALRDLDEAGIVRIGAEVKLRTTSSSARSRPRARAQLSPEERLLRAIFGEKAGDVRDTSLRRAAGRLQGTVIEAPRSSIPPRCREGRARPAALERDRRSSALHKRPGGRDRGSSGTQRLRARFKRHRWWASIAANRVARKSVKAKSKMAPRTGLTDHHGRGQCRQHPRPASGAKVAGLRSDGAGPGRSHLRERRGAGRRHQARCSTRRSKSFEEAATSCRRACSRWSRSIVAIKRKLSAG